MWLVSQLMEGTGIMTFLETTIARTLSILGNGELMTTEEEIDPGRETTLMIDGQTSPLEEVAAENEAKTTIEGIITGKTATPDQLALAEAAATEVVIRALARKREEVHTTVMDSPSEIVPRQSRIKQPRRNSSEVLETAASVRPLTLQSVFKGLLYNKPFEM